MPTEKKKYPPMHTEHERAWAYRQCAKVRRAHVHDYIGHYDVGQHSFGVILLLLQLHPHPDEELIKAAAHHDLAERWTGDIPYQAKRRLDLHGLVTALEEDIEAEWTMSSVSDLYAEEKLWLKACDLLELMMWCMEQQAMGCRTVDSILVRCRQSFAKWEASGNLPPEIVEFLTGLQWQLIEEPSV